MKKNNVIRIVPLLASVVLVSLAFVLYGGESQQQPLTESDATVIISQDRMVVEGITEMVEHATWVVSGRYTAFDATWNMSRDPNDPQKPSEKDYTEGRLYRFQVETVYIGDLEAQEILVSHRYSQRNSMPLLDKNKNISKTPTTFTVADPLYQEPVLGDEYVLFLTKGKTGYYQSPAHPFQVRIDESGIANLCTPLTDHGGPFLQTVDANGSELIVSIRAGYKISDTITGMSRQQLIDEIKSVGK